MKTQKVLELAWFELNKGADESAFLKVSETFKRDFLEKQDGLISRQVVRSDDGRWCVVAYWDTLENARAVVEKMKDDKISQDYLSFMDFSTVKIEHLFVVQE